MYISNWWDKQYNNSISSHAKDTTDVNLMYLKLYYSVYWSQTPNGLVPPSLKTVNVKSVLLSHQQQFPPAAQNTRLAALNRPANWKTKEAVCSMLICYR